jgi:hypothetical protein
LRNSLRSPKIPCVKRATAPYIDDSSDPERVVFGAVDSGFGSDAADVVAAVALGAGAAGATGGVAGGVTPGMNCPIPAPSRMELGTLR